MKKFYESITKIESFSNFTGKVKSAWKRLRVKAKIKKEKDSIKLTNGKVSAICLVKDGDYYLEEFIKHHRKLGVSQFVFIDNGSTDKTKNILYKKSDVKILSCNLPARKYENLIRTTAAQRFADGDWCLFVDVDEMFDYPESDKVSIDQLVLYLEKNSFTGVMAFMLDMFPNKPISEYNNSSFIRVIEDFIYYDMSDVQSYQYHDSNIGLADLLKDNNIPSSSFYINFGGIRKKVFGESCLLTKHPLVKKGGSVIAGRHPHISTGLSVADITGVIYHYKFANNIMQRDYKSIKSHQWDHGEDQKRYSAFSSNPNLTLKLDTAEVYENIDTLVEKKYITTSNKFQDFLKKISLSDVKSTE